jgi:hypothetical protein
MSFFDSRKLYKENQLKITLNYLIKSYPIYYYGFYMDFTDTLESKLEKKNKKEKKKSEG